MDPLESIVNFTFFIFLLILTFVCGALMSSSVDSQNSLQSKCSRLEGVYLDPHCVSKSVIIDLNK